MRNTALAQNVLYNGSTRHYSLLNYSINLKSIYNNNPFLTCLDRLIIITFLTMLDLYYIRRIVLYRNKRRLYHLRRQPIFSELIQNSDFQNSDITKQRLLQNSDCYKTATVTKQRQLQNSDYYKTAKIDIL